MNIKFPNSIGSKIATIGHLIFVIMVLKCMKAKTVIDLIIAIHQ